ncbi:peroxiredoxin [Aeromonas simiae]|uniref:Glutathione-dependent peroxiredoxin n=1 Tax=Aeromonas simiae TaxID=218936 RepID=A0A5J6WYY5_9GAMM|nr:redoxin family protein [Aeromonas simiae]QFI55307.1 redoxin domain-containing protein [Aeromonas simiae]
MISEGSTLPDHEFTFITPEGKVTRSSRDLFGGKRIVLFAVPGAFTPTCSNAHLPGYVVKADEFAACGVDGLCCLSVNDAFVMRAWQREQNAEAITMLADGDGCFVTKLGLGKETGAFGGLRAQRFALIADDGVVTRLRVEAPGQFEVSDAESLLALL